MLHMCYIQKRRPGWTKEEFTARLRAHYRLAASLPGFYSQLGRYVQNDILEELEGVPRVAVGYDMVGELYLASPDATGVPEGEEREVLAADSAQYQGVTGLHFLGEQRILRGTPAGRYKIVVFARRRAGIDAATFDRAVLVALSETPPEPVLGVAYSSRTREASRFDGVLLLWVDSPETAREVIQGPGWQALETAMSEVADADDTYVLIGRENVLLEDPTNSFAVALDPGD